MPKYDPKVIESKWRKIFGEKKIYEPEIDNDREKFFTTVPVIYPTGLLHLGHLYTWTRADIYARFMRMRGFNVLFPQGFHMTGGPMVGMSLRLKNREKKAVDMMKDQGVSDEEIEKFSNDPIALGLYFSDTYIKDFDAAGMSIDWRRLFILSQTPQYSKFVEWQFNTLKRLGLIVQGTHPVIWCPKEDTPLGDHDRLSGEGESPLKFSVIKFRMEDYILPVGTLRPETMFGVANLWLNSRIAYKKLTLDSGEEWIVSGEFARKIRYLLKTVKKEEDFDVSSVMGKNAKNPLNGADVPVFDADFVDGDAMTGVVMSVPMHAPVDFVYANRSGALEKLGGRPKKIIDVEGEENLVEDAIKRFGETPEGLDKATKYVYKKEFSSGILNTNCGKFANTAVDKAREKIKDLLREKGSYEDMYEPSGAVVCRCGANGVVKLLENQWFIHYSDRELKEKMLRAVEEMKICPEEVRVPLVSAINGLEDKAAARHGGLGTPLPWDKNWLIEPLSDSTIYMAYYTIADTANKMRPEELDDRLFDYVFLGKKDSSPYPDEAEKMRKEFLYWYPVDMRTTAKELVPNHMVFFIANHVAIFDRDKWPKAMSINGWLVVNKQKMSKSKGNTMGISEAVESYGTDSVRLIATASDGIDDAEWDTSNINTVYQKIETLMDLIEILDDFKGHKKLIDKYALSKAARITRDATEDYGNMLLRSAVQRTFFDGVQLLKEYLELGGYNGETLRELIRRIVRLNHPIFPFVTEELNSAMGGKELLEGGKSWPEYDEREISRLIDSEVEVVRNTISDIRNLTKILKISPKKVRIGISKPENFDLYNRIVEETKNTRNANEIRKKIRSSSKLADKLLKNPNRLPENGLDHDTETKLFEETKESISRIFGCEVIVESSDDDKAIPGKPALTIS